MNDDLANAMTAVLYKYWSHESRDESTGYISTVFSCEFSELVQQILMCNDLNKAIVSALCEHFAYGVRIEHPGHVSTVFSCRLCDLVQEILNEVRSHGEEK